MTVRLRPHHLLCVLTYVGKGYSPAFVRNYDSLAQRIGAGEGVRIVEGPDDVCAPIVEADGSHCQHASVAERDRRALRDVGVILDRALSYGDDLSFDPTMQLRCRDAFVAGVTRGACNGCEWSSLCTQVASHGFDGARVR